MPVKVPVKVVMIVFVINIKDLHECSSVYIEDLT